MSDTWQENEFDEQKLQQVAALNPADIRLKAMDLLARRDHSRQELMQKLLRRFKDADLIDEQLDRLVAENLQSDTRFAEAFLCHRFNRGYGPRRIFQEMQKKGIAEEEIQAAMDAGAFDWHANAEHVLSRKYGTARAEDINEKARRSRFMQYRGFSSDQFRDIL